MTDPRTTESRIVVVVYQDQNGTWDARNSANQIIASGGANDPQPRTGDIIHDA